MKILHLISGNILFFLTLFLLAFIPLYPKIPLLDVEHTWVYVRLEDFAVAITILVWFLFLLSKKVTLRTPLTLPIMLFWIVGAIATLHGVLLLFPTLSDVFSNVAFLSWLRRIEYMFLFFVAYASMRDKKFLPYVVLMLVFTLLLVVGYGVGQKFLGFPAYLTMNEEFAKGIPIQLSSLSRVPSTFAGHYDLAAYLVLVIPILVSLVFGFKNWLAKFLLLATVALGFGLLFLTVSRVSFFVLLLSVVAVLILQKKRLFIVSFLLLAIVFLSFSPSLLQRFSNSLKEVDVLVEVKTGRAIGQIRKVPAVYFKDKIVKIRSISTQDAKQASASAILPFSLIPQEAILLVEGNSPTGENLPSGTGYINLPLSPVLKRESQYFYQKANVEKKPGEQEDVLTYYGDFLIKRAFAYDLSFTTRFQGEWPKTLLAFKRNIFLGSGYGAVSLAVDNNYLRILGESGLGGLASFFAIFLMAGIYIRKLLPKVDSPLVKSFVFGFIAGTIGLALNAVLIDVFEASKIAFSYWLLMGITIGTLHLYKKEEVDLFGEFKKAVTSTSAVVVYLLIAAASILFSASSYYFVGDDFTWLRWVSQSSSGVFSYFTDASGFFYRPGAKIYFSLMYSAFWLNQTMYHFVSLFLHFLVAFLLFLLAKKVLKSYFLSAVSAVLFLLISGHHEAIFWISSTGFLFNAVFALMSILFFIYWKEKRKTIYFVICLASIVFSLLFHEVGVVVPLLVILYDIVFGQETPLKLFKKIYFALLSPILPYLFLRLIAKSHWFSGDYSYNLINLPFNIVGNAIGYLMLSLFGPVTIPLYQRLRSFAGGHTLFTALALIVIIFLGILLYRLFSKKIVGEERKIIIFASLFFVLSLLPFLGLGNIASRYSYLASFGTVLILVFFLKKIYAYLLDNGRYIAMAGVALVTLLFLIINLFQLQKLSTDWRNAGEGTKGFLVALNSIFVNKWAEGEAELYFVDVPIKKGEAWVFPVGFEDAIWFAFQNKSLTISRFSSLDLALDQKERFENARVFQFDKKGNLKEAIRSKDNQIEFR